MKVKLSVLALVVLLSTILLSACDPSCARRVLINPYSGERCEETVPAN